MIDSEYSHRIYVTGHPRSGNTWLIRMLSDVLKCPLCEEPGNKHTFYGDASDSPLAIYKRHSLDLSKEASLGARIVYIYRDPRDVITSMMFYRCYNTIEDTMAVFLSNMKRPEIDMYGTAQEFYENWYLSGNANCVTSYELMHRHGATELRRVAECLSGQEISLETAAKSFTHQSFKSYVERNGKEHAMRSGRVGDWSFYFTRKDAKTITEHFGKMMIDLGYIDSLNWYESIKFNKEK